MKDRLENFIKEHRNEFDDLEPRADTWQKIQQELKPEEQKKDHAWLWKAAAVIFLCLSVGLALERTWQQDHTQMAKNEVSASSSDTELREVERYYTQLIVQKRGEIRSVIEEKRLDDNELLQDMGQLDNMYARLKKDLEKNQNDERLINALIQNLQLRVEILNKQLKILERISKQDEDEKISV